MKTKDLIKKFKKTNSYEEKDEIHKQFLKKNNFEFINSIIIVKHELNQPVYRVSREFCENMDLFDNFIFPPKNKTGLGRANIENYPVFYTNINDFGAIKECTIKKDEPFYLSEWYTDNEYINSHLFFSNKYTNPLYKEIMNEKLNEFKSYLDKNNQKKILEYMFYQGDSFIDDNTHELSSYLTHNILYNYEMNKELKKNKQKPVISVIYPSIADNQETVNIAFHPKVIYKKILKLNNIKKCIYHGDNSYSIINIGFYDLNKKIHWQNNEDNALFEIQTLYDKNNKQHNLYCKSIKISYDN